MNAFVRSWPDENFIKYKIKQNPKIYILQTQIKQWPKCNWSYNIFVLLQNYQHTAWYLQAEVVCMQSILLVIYN